VAADLGADVPIVALDAGHYARLDRPRELATLLNHIAAEAPLTGAEPGPAAHRGA